MRFLNNFGPVFLLLFLTGCAVGNQYDYQSSNIALPLSGSGDVGLGVIDNRAYVLSGDKEANFVGLQRGGFNNPFDVTTLSGKPLTDDMAMVLEKGISKAGFTVTRLTIESTGADAVAAAVTSNGKDRNIILTVTEWKTSIYMKLKLFYELALEVVNANGVTVASNKMQGEETLTGGGFESQNSRTSAAAFETKIGRLFNNDSIREALE